MGLSQEQCCIICIILLLLILLLLLTGKAKCMCKSGAMSSVARNMKSRLASMRPMQ